MMAEQFLFTLPPKPRQRLSDEPVAQRVADAMIRRIDGDLELHVNQRDELVVALMATNSDSPDVVLDWISENEPQSWWLDEWHTDELRDHLQQVAERVLPRHERAGRFA